MKARIVRKLDELGRIIIPAEMRNEMGWDRNTKITICREEEKLVLQTYQGICFACGSDRELKQIHEKYICEICIDEVRR